MRANGLIFGLLAVLCCSCGPNDAPGNLIRDNDQYVATLGQVADLTRGPFAAVHDGHPISDNERRDLTKAEKMIESLIAYKPDNYGPYILKGLTLRALDRPKEAERAYKQGLLYTPQTMKPEDKIAVSQIYDEIATLYFEQQNYAQAEEHADKAVSLSADNPSVLANAASVKIQLNKLDEARKLLTQAAKLDPNDARTKQLQRLIDPAAK
ncbi:MAG: tetratricopeptide repeat protein [Armatimonadetes bacterium]|nr:tetratricopeptide repeat protein [Armatimonadota bacterium]